METLSQPFALVNQSLRHIPVHLRMLCLCGFCEPLRSVGGLLLPLACCHFFLPQSLSLRSMPVVALCALRRVRLLLYLCTKIGLIFELVSSLTQEVQVIHICYWMRGFHRPGSIEDVSHAHACPIFHKLPDIPYHCCKADNFIDKAIGLSILHIQLAPFPQSAIPIRVTAKAAFQTLAKPVPGSQLVLGIKLDPSSFGHIFVNEGMSGVIPFFAIISQERDDEADFIDFLHQGIAEVVQLNLDIMYEALCVLGIPGEGVNSKFLWLLRPMR